jgi:hypothetical protein
MMKSHNLELYFIPLSFYVKAGQMSLSEAERLGGSLVLVASQEAREKAVLGNKYDPLQVLQIRTQSINTIS